MKKYFIRGICVLFLISLATVTTSAYSMDYTPHNPIVIENNQQFIPEKGVAAGSGSKEGPYLIEGWRIEAKDSEFGIHIANTDRHFVIRDCKVVSAKADGILLERIRNGRVENTELSNNNAGITLRESKAVRITENLIKANSYGIASERTSYIWITSNQIEENTFGIYLQSSSTNKIHENTIRSNTWNGITLDSSCRFNEFIGNIFLKNGVNHVFDNGMNNWNGEHKGNYWDDYTGKDKINDGIGDSPYRIPGSGKNYDRRPLMQPPGSS